MKRLGGLRVIASFGAAAFVLGGCSGRDVASIPQATTDTTLVSGSRAQVAESTSVAVAQPADGSSVSLDAGDSAAVAEAAFDAVDPISDSAPADVAGTYGGTIQDRSAGFVATGRIQLILHQSGSTVSGFIKTESNPPPNAAVRRTIVVEHTFTGTASATTKGVLLKLSIADSQDQTTGFWVKIIGTTLFGKGWVDPNPTYDLPYEQLLFTLHKRT